MPHRHRAVQNELVDVDAFIRDGYMVIRGAFDADIAAACRARGLLALFLFSDVGQDDAPTRLVRGSHLAVPQFLAPYGETGTHADAEFWRASTLCLPVAHATGRAGDIYLCHPFIVHTATWPHPGHDAADDRPARRPCPRRVRDR
jgi:hypothetical protein